MTEIKSIEEFHEFINHHRFSFIFISREECGVCHALLPQVEELLQRFPEIQLGHIDAGVVEEIAGLLMVFTVPVLLLFVEGRNTSEKQDLSIWRCSRKKISKIYHGMITG